MAQNPNQAITGNNSFSQETIQIIEESDFNNIPAGINICSLSQDLIINDLDLKPVTIRRGRYLTFGIGTINVGRSIILLNALSGNFKLLATATSFSVTERW